MRILFCSDTYPPQVNGVSVVTAISVRGLIARGWECEVIAPRYPERAGGLVVDDGGAPRTSIASIPAPVYHEIRLAAPAWGTVRAVAERFRPDLVHCATEFVVGRLGRRASRRLGVPFCTSYHTDFARYTAAYGMPWLRGPVTRAIAAFHDSAARTFTPSDPAREDLHRIGVERVEVWGRGVDVEQFHPRKRSTAVREALRIGDAFTFLHVGRLAPEKHVDCLLDAFTALESSLPPGRVRLVIAGTGPSLPALRARAGSGVTFLGTLDRTTALPELYASADAFLFSSTTETLGLVILEAMASGLPVLATPAGGVATNLRDEVNGLAFAARDARACSAVMRRLMADPSLAARLRDGARAHAEARSWEVELDRLDAAYREVLSSPSSP
jgi:phosphatidylinositol alpha 1,6-mannosyltransferase